MNIENAEFEFRRQIYLCSTIPEQSMYQIVLDAWRNGVENYVCPGCGEKASFAEGHINCVKK